MVIIKVHFTICVYQLEFPNARNISIKTKNKIFKQAQSLTYSFYRQQKQFFFDSFNETGK